MVLMVLLVLLGRCCADNRKIVSVNDERLVIWEGSKSVGDLLYERPGVSSVVVIVSVFRDV